MTQPQSGSAGRFTLVAMGIVFLLAGGTAGWFWHARASHSATGPAAGMASADRAAIEQVVREYILNNPEILPEAMENLQKREAAKQISGVQDDIETPFPGAVLGNPAGTVTLVEFTDFACTYCRQSLADVDALIAGNPDLRVVVRELPILSPESADAARWALAAAGQGRYPQFHAAMFAAGRPAADTIAAAASAAGLDMDRARKAIADPQIEAELKRNAEFARQLGFSGTPSWVVGKQLLSGAVGKDTLAKAIAEARP